MAKESGLLGRQSRIYIWDVRSPVALTAWESRMPKTKQQHLDATNGPKRILALDGGGIRGILTLEYLEVMESEFRRRFNNPDFLLCDYFDLIGGTSTGSIIAAGLACGMKVKQLKKLYTGIGTDVFQAEFWRLGLLAPK